MNPTPYDCIQKEAADLRRQLREKDHQISRLNAQVSSLTVDVDELKHHRQELRALNDFYKTQSEKFRLEAENAKGETAALRQEVEKAGEEWQKARAEVAELRAALKTAEGEAVVSRVGKRDEQSDRGGGLSIEERLALPHEAGQQRQLPVRRVLACLSQSLSSPFAQQNSGLLPSRESMSPLTEPELEYVSDTQDNAHGLNSLQTTSQSSRRSVPQSKHPQPMDIDSVDPPHLSGVAQASGPSASKSKANNSSAAEGHTIVQDLNRCPSVELLDAPPPISSQTRRSLGKRARRGEKDPVPVSLYAFHRRPATEVDVYQMVPGLQPSAKALGKRKAPIPGPAPATPSKKSRPSAAPPVSTSHSARYPAVMNVILIGGNNSIHCQIRKRGYIRTATPAWIRSLGCASRCENGG